MKEGWRRTRSISELPRPAIVIRGEASKTRLNLHNGGSVKKLGRITGSVSMLNNVQRKPFHISIVFEKQETVPRRCVFKVFAARGRKVKRKVDAVSVPAASTNANQIQGTS